MTDAERSLLEKEILGLKAKLRWDHLGEGTRQAYEIRIRELEARLKGGG